MYNGPTHGIVHAGFRGMRVPMAIGMARKKSWCKPACAVALAGRLIGNSLVIPHDTIPSNTAS
ncbi:MAG: hypothetical protein KJ754_07525 [Bacteroidetes bacterium]|nr:hypothetical protein [Bacteroidota bacterium]MBU1579263.1 hypothetical protein [Bacteroidota bacterium]MBU2465857.1 hypothetical protein [Bacteroidota bacterium]